MELTEGLSKSKSELKEIRDSKIIKLAPEYSVNDICYLYNLREARVKEILRNKNIDYYSDNLSEVERTARNKDLKSFKISLCNELVQQGLTRDDVYYIHQRAFKDDKSTQDKLAKKLLDCISDSTPEPADTELSLANEEIKLLNEQIEELKSQLVSKDKLVDGYKKKVSKAIKELESEKQNNNKVRLSLQNKISNKDDEITDLKESLLSVKESNKSLSVKYAETELLLKSQNQRATSAELVNADLQKRIAELENSLNQQTEANLKLQSENEALKKEVETLESDFDKLAFSEDIKIEKIDSKYKKIFDREQIKSVYIDNDFCLKATYESLQNQFVYISYRHLQNILKEEGIYKHTYKVKKKRQKK